MSRVVPKLTPDQASFFQKLLRKRTDFTNSVGAEAGFSRNTQPQEVFCVSVTVDGGSAGGGASSCSYTYTIKRRGSSTPILTGVTPERPRMAFVQYVAPSANSIGYAFFDNDGELKLIEAIEERPETEVCAES